MLLYASTTESLQVFAKDSPLSNTKIPRSEYPRPQFVRTDDAGNAVWLCLNGPWQFEVDSGDSGKERGLLDRNLNQQITVPFCPESELSGIQNTDFLNAVWYRREVAIPADWKGSDVLLHFGAVDYDTTVWVNGTEVARHRGGFTPITCHLKDVARPGETATIVLRARDTNWIPQARGKQAQQYAPFACLYTRTTGIWQTVWMEPVPSEGGLKDRPRITPDVANSAFHLEIPLTQNRAGWQVRAALKDSSGVITEAAVRADLDFAPRLTLSIPEERRRLWSPRDPFLYDLEIALVDGGGAVVDRYVSYAGLRSVSIEGKRVKINGETLFQRLVLDQGYYPDGVMTAPSDAALEADILLSLEAGFNGARLHQKVFEERFLYHADRLGYLVWGEFPDWGVGGYGPSHDHQQIGITFAAQWLEELARDYSHPSIVGWCALNETWQVLHDRVTLLDDATRALFLAAKAMDTTRPVLDASGYSHRVAETDIYDSHDYIEQKDFAEGFAQFQQRHVGLSEDKALINPQSNDGNKKPDWSVPYRGQPYFVSEFGGFRWNPEKMTREGGSWGYGGDPTSLDDFYHRFDAVCTALLDNAAMFGYCYTQLTDIFPEENGIYTFDRRRKFDNRVLRKTQQRPAAIEEA